MTKIHLHAAMPSVLFSGGGAIDVTVSGYLPESDESLRDTIGAATVALVTVIKANLDDDGPIPESEEESA